MEFTGEQLATAVLGLSSHFSIGTSEEQNPNRVLAVLFNNLAADLRDDKPLGTSFCELAKLARKFRSSPGSMSHIPERLAERLASKSMITTIDGVRVEFTFFGPRDVDRPSADPLVTDRRLYLELKYRVLPTFELESTLLALPHELPSPPRDFTGRDDALRDLLAAIRYRGATIVGLRGLGGVGKTTLALALGRQLTNSYTAQVYLDLQGISRQPLTTSDVIQHVVRAFSNGQPPSGSDAQLRGFYQTILAKERALLLFDNAKNAAQLQPLIPPDHCLLVFTSRQHFSLPGAYVVDVMPFPPDEACALLLAIAPRSAPETDRIAHLCGCLPLALRAAASVLAIRPDITPSDYAERLQSTRERLELRDPTSDVTVEASLSLSYDLLSSATQSLFAALSAFSGTFDVDAAIDLWNLPRWLTIEALGTLMRHSLLEFDAASARYRLHDLVRAFADTHLQATDRDKLQATVARHAIRLLQRSTDVYETTITADNEVLQPLTDGAWDTVRGALTWAREHLDDHRLAWQLLDAYDAMFTRQFAELTTYLERLIPHSTSSLSDADAARARLSYGAQMPIISRATTISSLALAALAHARRGELTDAIIALQRLLELLDARETLVELQAGGAALRTVFLALFVLDVLQRTNQCDQTTATLRGRFQQMLRELRETDAT